MNYNLTSTLNMLSNEKQISKDIMIDTLKSALIIVFKKKYGFYSNFKVEICKKMSFINIYIIKKVIANNKKKINIINEIFLKNALLINKKYKINDFVYEKLSLNELSRISIQNVKNIILQRFKEIERKNIYMEFIKYENKIINGIVSREDKNYIYINIGRVETILKKSINDNNKYKFNDNIKVYVTNVKKSLTGLQIIVSRTHINFIKCLFEKEIPEIQNGIVEIKNIVREVGIRSKISVKSNNKNIDPVGACLGVNGIRIISIIKELNGENIDVIYWNENNEKYIANSLKPAFVNKVEIYNEKKNNIFNIYKVFIKKDQLSLAIGKKGQNVRLASKLTGFKLNIVEDNFLKK